MKVETYHAQLSREKQLPDDVTETHSKAKNLNVDTKLGDLWKFLSIGGSFGLDEKHGVEGNYRVHLVGKLLAIVEELGRQRKIGLLDDVLKAGQTRGYEFLYLRNPMRIASYDDQKAKIEASVGQTILELTCSIRNFSEYASDSAVFRLHSGNYDFFEGRVQPNLTALIIPLDSSDGRLIATPLFLAIDTQAGIKI